MAGDEINPAPKDASKKLAAGEDEKGLSAVIGHLSRTTIGPDPETTKIIAEVDRHKENVRLEGFKQLLANRDKQNQRDHEFRLRILRHRSIKESIVTAVSVIGLALELYLYITDKSDLGGYVLVASLMAFLQATTSSTGRGGTMADCTLRRQGV